MPIRDGRRDMWCQTPELARPHVGPLWCTSSSRGTSVAVGRVVAVCSPCPQASIGSDFSVNPKHTGPAQGSWIETPPKNLLDAVAQNNHHPGEPCLDAPSQTGSWRGSEPCPIRASPLLRRGASLFPEKQANGRDRDGDCNPKGVNSSWLRPLAQPC